MTSSIKWEPIEDLKAMRDMAARLLPHKHAPGTAKCPPMDLYEEPDAFVLEVGVAGATAEDVDISVGNSELLVEVEYAVPEGRDYLYQERPKGKIVRSVTLPQSVDTDKIQAKLGNGLLVLTMPKVPAAKEVKIDVSQGS